MTDSAAALEGWLGEHPTRIEFERPADGHWLVRAKSTEGWVIYPPAPTLEAAFRAVSERKGEA